MRITFELEKKDILAFHIHTIFHSKNLRILYVFLFLFQAYFAFSPLFSWLFLERMFELYEIGVIINVVFQMAVNFLFSTLIWLGLIAFFNAVHLFFLMFRYKNNDGSLGQHLIELRENELLEATDVNETLHNWKSVRKIVEGRNYIFIYVSPTNAHIIPKRFFKSDEEASAFIDEANSFKESAKTKFSPSYLASSAG